MQRPTTDSDSPLLVESHRPTYFPQITSLVTKNCPDSWAIAQTSPTISRVSTDLATPLDLAYKPQRPDHERWTNSCLRSPSSRIPALTESFRPRRFNFSILSGKTLQSRGSSLSSYSWTRKRMEAVQMIHKSDFSHCRSLTTSSMASKCQRPTPTSTSRD